MATDRNVYELIDEYNCLGVNMKNVYFYQIGTGLSFDAQDLADDWVANVLPDILPTQTADVTHTRVGVRNLFDAAETGEVLHTVVGTAASQGDKLEPFAAAGITLARQTGATRNGKKRIFAGGEFGQVGGVWQSGTWYTALLTAATEIASTITVSLVQRWFPVIVKRILDGANYRLPATQAEATVNGVDGAVVSSFVTTQNSRKFGVGE